jgi:hypothetical protein
MMSTETAFETLRRVNPVPDPAAFRAHLEERRDAAAATTPRRHTMDTMTPTTEKPRTPPKAATGRWIPAVAAAAVILLVAPFVLFREGGPFRTSTPTPTQVAEAYIGARNAYDADAMASLFPEGFTGRPDDWATGLHDLDLALEARRIHGFETRLIECSPIPNQPAMVTCSTEVQTALHQIIGYPPTAADFWFMVSDEGRITNYTDGFLTAEVEENVWAPFVGWLYAEHPEAADILQTGGAPNLTAEAFELTPIILADYRDWVGAGGYDAWLREREG